jgi:uncharacterized protein YkwD
MSGKDIALFIGIVLIIIILMNLHIFPLMGDQQALELRVHDLINQERNKNEVHSLNFDSDLAEIARKHSEDMASNHELVHTYYAPSDSKTNTGYPCYNKYGSFSTTTGFAYATGVGENIQQNNLEIYDLVYMNAFDHLASSIVYEWMNSPGHKLNIMSPSYTREGIGIAVNGAIYITEVFC